MPKYKKEKYITERKNKKGTSFQICIHKNGQTVTSTVKGWDFPSDRQALEYAKHIRDTALIELSKDIIRKSFPPLKYFYDKSHELSGVTIKTRNRHDSIYKQCIQEYENFPLNEIKASDIQSSLVSYAKDHSQKQVNRAYGLWKDIYECAQIEEYNITDKTLSVQIPKGRKIVSKKETDTSAEIFEQFSIALLQYNMINNQPNPKSKMYWYILWILYYTGCRPAEIFAISASDIDLENNLLNINKQVGSTSDAIRQIVITKSSDSIRKIPITEKLHLLFESILKEYKTSPLFLAEDGLPVDTTDFSNYIMRVAKQNKIQFNSYRLRHLFSTDLFASHENEIVIKSLMGHSSIKTSAYYANASDSDRLNAMKIREK